MYGTYPLPFSAQGYDAMAICLKAIEIAANGDASKIPDRGDISNAIRGLVDFKGITGTFTFNDKGDPILGNYYVIKVNSGNPNDWSNNSYAETLQISPP